MNKIICDICGTTYPESSECCPICGCTNAAAADLLRADMDYEAFDEEIPGEHADKPVNSRKKEIFDYDEVNTEDSDEEADDDEYDAEEEEDGEAPRHNTFVVILLTVLIVALLGAAAFIFVRYFLPNMREEEPATTAAVQETAPAATTEAVIPCEQMFMTSAGVAELSAEGQQFLLHIKVIPEDTTDQIIYTSGDESIATVTEDGKITAVSEGETVIYISCGEYYIDCPVIVKYVEETVPPTTEAEAETVPAETTPEETVAEETSSGSENNAGLKDVTLKLKKTDIQLGVYYQFQLVLDCALEPEEVTWTSEHPHIATVDEKGNVTAVKEGTTSISAKYGDQEVQCIVRCIWY